MLDSVGSLPRSELGISTGIPQVAYGGCVNAVIICLITTSHTEYRVQEDRSPGSRPETTGSIHVGHMYTPIHSQTQTIRRTWYTSCNWD